MFGTGCGGVSKSSCVETHARYMQSVCLSQNRDLFVSVSRAHAIQAISAVHCSQKLGVQLKLTHQHLRTVSLSKASTLLESIRRVGHITIGKSAVYIAE